MPQLNIIYYPIVIFWSLFFFFLLYYVFSNYILLYFCRTYKFINFNEMIIFFFNKLNIFLNKLIFLTYFNLNLIFFFYLKFYFLKFYFLFLKLKFFFNFKLYLEFLYSISFYKNNLNKIFKFKVKNILNFFIILDLPYEGQFLFQDPATPIMEGIINFHHDLLFIQIFIATFVLWMLMRILFLFRRKINRVFYKTYYLKKNECSYIIDKAMGYNFPLTSPYINRFYKFLIIKYLFYVFKDDLEKVYKFRKNYYFRYTDVYKRALILKATCNKGGSLMFTMAQDHREKMFFADLTKFFWKIGIFYRMLPSTVDLGYDLRNQNPPSKIVHNTLLEIIWTVIPSLILIYIAIPSFALLYAMDELVAPAITVKVIGNQWYWRYELSVIKDSHYIFTDFNNFFELEKKFNSLGQFGNRMYTFCHFCLREEFPDFLTSYDHHILYETSAYIKAYSNKLKFHEDLSFIELYSDFNMDIIGAAFLRKKKDFFINLGMSRGLITNIDLAFLLVDKLFLVELYKNNCLSDLVNKYGKITFESRLVGTESASYYMIPTKVGLYRLLDTDNALILPEKISIRLLITASDVLHSWAVPSFGIKLDACPGRLNQTGLFLKRVGTFYGQCSEICGINHAFMPIVVKSVSEESYDLFRENFLITALSKFIKF